MAATLNLINIAAPEASSNITAMATNMWVACSAGRSIAPRLEAVADQALSLFAHSRSGSQVAAFCLTYMTLFAFWVRARAEDRLFPLQVLIDVSFQGLLLTAADRLAT